MYLAQSWDWDQQLDATGSNKIALDYDIKPELPDIFTDIAFAEEVGIQQTDIGALIPMSTNDENRQRNALETFHLARQQQEHDNKVKHDEWREEVIRIQEERVKQAYENWGWSWSVSEINKVFKHWLAEDKRPIIVPPMPTIACCPY